MPTRGEERSAGVDKSRFQPVRDADREPLPGERKYRVGQEWRFFIPSFSPRYGEKFSELLWCPHSRRWRRRDDFSGEQRLARRTERFSQDFSHVARHLTRECMTPALSTCYQMWMNLSPAGKSRLAAQNGNGVAAELPFVSDWDAQDAAMADATVVTVFASRPPCSVVAPPVRILRRRAAHRCRRHASPRRRQRLRGATGAV